MKRQLTGNPKHSEKKLSHCQPPCSPQIPRNRTWASAVTKPDANCHNHASLRTSNCSATRSVLRKAVNQLTGPSFFILSYTQSHLSSNALDLPFSAFPLRSIGFYCTQQHSLYAPAVSVCCQQTSAKTQTNAQL